MCASCGRCWRAEPIAASASRFFVICVPEDEDDPEARRAPIKGGSNRRPRSWIVNGRGDTNHALNNTLGLQIRSTFLC